MAVSVTFQHVRHQSVYDHRGTPPLARGVTPPPPHTVEMILTTIAETTAVDAPPITDWITAIATVLALIISALLGAVSIAMTTRDRRDRRAVDREQRTRVFGYGELEKDGVRVRLVNGTAFPVRQVGVYVMSYMSSPQPKVLHKGTQTTVPHMSPGSEEELWFGFDRHSHMADMKGDIGLRIGFIDINGQAWIRRPDGRVLKQEELKGSAGFELPRDMYSYSGPHTTN